jgi:hypothetical protein
MGQIDDVRACSSSPQRFLERDVPVKARHPVILMDSTDTKRIEFLTARRKRFRNLRFFIPLVGLYILYDGIRTIIRKGQRPPSSTCSWPLSPAHDLCLFQNEKRIRDVESELTDWRPRKKPKALSVRRNPSLMKSRKIWIRLKQAG